MIELPSTRLSRLSNPINASSWAWYSSRLYPFTFTSPSVTFHLLRHQSLGLSFVLWYPTNSSFLSDLIWQPLHSSHTFLVQVLHRPVAKPRARVVDKVYTWLQPGSPYSQLFFSLSFFCLPISLYQFVLSWLYFEVFRDGNSTMWYFSYLRHLLEPHDVDHNLHAALLRWLLQFTQIGRLFSLVISLLAVCLLVEVLLNLKTLLLVLPKSSRISIPYIILGIWTSLLPYLTVPGKHTARCQDQNKTGGGESQPWKENNPRHCQPRQVASNTVGSAIKSTSPDERHSSTAKKSVTWH